MTNFVITGLTRTGTTILARFVAGLPGCHVLFEPYQTAKKHNLPLFASLANITPDTIRNGIKEPYFGPYAPGAAFHNSDILRTLKADGWTFIYITRNPIWTLNSRKHAGWPTDLDAWAKNYKEFESFRGRAPAIAYDDFCLDPIGTWNKVMPLPIRATEVRLGNCPEPFLGDRRAKESTSISFRDMPMILTQEEIAKAQALL